ncbi:transketolase, partial [Raoultella ornithinolytica]|nr:transketolase [Raoultella ornithinolytica]
QCDALPRGEQAEQSWNQRFAAYQQQYPEMAAELKRRMDGALQANWSDAALDYIAQLQAEPAKISIRKASQNALNAYGPL